MLQIKCNSITKEKVRCYKAEVDNLPNYRNKKVQYSNLFTKRKFKIPMLAGCNLVHFLLMMTSTLFGGG